MEYWYLIALGASFVSAIYVCVNQFMRVDGNVAMTYRGLLTAIILLPFTLFFDPIINPMFYVYVFIQGILIYMIDYRMFKYATQLGAEVTSLFQPLSIIAIFLLWIAINPLKYAGIWDNKIIFGAEILCLLFITFATIKLKQAKASKDAMPFIIPMVFLAVAIDIMNKLAMGAGAENLASAVFYYNLIASAVVGACAINRYKASGVKYDFFKRENLFVGLAIVAVAFALTVTKNISMHYTPNPGYVSAIMGIAPLFVVLINFIMLRLGIISSVKRISIKYTTILIVGVSAMIYLANINH